MASGAGADVPDGVGRPGGRAETQSGNDGQVDICKIVTRIWRWNSLDQPGGGLQGLDLRRVSRATRLRSRGLVRKVLHQFKYGKQRHLRYPIASWLVESLGDPRIRGRHFDLIVPVPLHPARERERGFNQAALLAELIAGPAAVPSRPVLERIRYTTTQTAYDRAERMENLHGAFRLRKNRDVRGLRVLLIDDVLTTGSTLSECARVLRRAGAVSVHGATAARA